MARCYGPARLHVLAERGGPGRSIAPPVQYLPRAIPVCAAQLACWWLTAPGSAKIAGLLAATEMDFQRAVIGTAEADQISSDRLSGKEGPAEVPERLEPVFPIELHRPGDGLRDRPGSVARKQGLIPGWPCWRRRAAAVSYRSSLFLVVVEHIDLALARVAPSQRSKSSRKSCWLQWFHIEAIRSGWRRPQKPETLFEQRLGSSLLFISTALRENSCALHLSSP
jgi:hypothetical protein